nr:hypothetical protein asmbl_16 [uncultured bacterium]
MLHGIRRRNRSLPVCSAPNDGARRPTWQWVVPELRSHEGGLRRAGIEVHPAVAEAGWRDPVDEQIW